MNRTRLDCAASRNASGVLGNASYPIGSSAGSKHGMRKLERYFLPSPHAIGV
jgi:hypothetical protein